MARLGGGSSLVKNGPGPKVGMRSTHFITYPSLFPNGKILLFVKGKKRYTYMALFRHDYVKT